MDNEASDICNASSGSATSSISLLMPISENEPVSAESPNVSKANNLGLMEPQQSNTINNNSQSESTSNCLKDGNDAFINNKSCPLCNKRFQNQKKLQSHIRSHFLPFECSICEMAFSHIFKLKKHMSVHSSDELASHGLPSAVSDECTNNTNDSINVGERTHADSKNVEPARAVRDSANESMDLPMPDFNGNVDVGNKTSEVLKPNKKRKSKEVCENFIRSVINSETDDDECYSKFRNETLTVIKTDANKEMGTSIRERKKAGTVPHETGTNESRKRNLKKSILIKKRIIPKATKVEIENKIIRRHSARVAHGFKKCPCCVHKADDSQHRPSFIKTPASNSVLGLSLPKEVAKTNNTVENKTRKKKEIKSTEETKIVWNRNAKSTKEGSSSTKGRRSKRSPRVKLSTSFDGDNSDNDEKPYECLLCGARVRLKNSLKRHMAVHSGVKPFACKECNYKTTRAEYLRLHMMTHTKNFLYKCSACNVHGKFFSQLKEHVKNAHKAGTAHVIHFDTTQGESS